MFQDCHFLSNLTKQLQVKQKSNMMHKLKQTSNISTSYLGSLFVGQYNLDDMLSYFHTMIEKLNLDVQLLLCLGMDGPNVNKCFQNKLGEEFLVKANISWNMSSAFCFNCIFRRFKKTCSWYWFKSVHHRSSQLFQIFIRLNIREEFFDMETEMIHHLVTH